SQSWEECWNGEKLSSCGWALADLPGAKTAKGTAKALAKVLGRLQEIFSRCKKCFLAGTLILMAGGGSKAIEDVQTGDKVLATDPLTGESSPREVAATIITEDDRQFVAITVSTHNGEEEITATHEHPFWVEDEKKWLAADKLQHGMKLRTDHGGLVSVVAMRQYTEHATTYNLTVEGIHTYYVLAGSTPVLVHNSNGCVNWAANSVKTWGHTFKTHGAGAKNTKALTDRARSTNNQQGQWLDNDAAAEFLQGLHVEGAGPRSVRIPDGLGQVIMPDGSIVQARAATIIPSPNGLYKTGFPIIGPN
ncbi:Hint domain-containing protein, partial [Kitasatospora sp. NPDC056808]